MHIFLCEILVLKESTLKVISKVDILLKGFEQWKITFRYEISLSEKIISEHKCQYKYLLGIDLK